MEIDTSMAYRLNVKTACHKKLTEFLKSEFLELKPFLVPAVQTRQKVGSSTISLGTMKRFLRWCERPYCVSLVYAWNFVLRK